MPTLAQLLDIQHIRDAWRTACGEAIFELARDPGRRFMLIFN